MTFDLLKEEYFFGASLLETVPPKAATRLPSALKSPHPAESSRRPRAGSDESEQNSSSGLLPGPSPERAESFLIPRRFSSANAWSGSTGFMQECSAGIRIACRTDAKRLRIRAKLGPACFEFGHGVFDVFVNGEIFFSALPEPPWDRDAAFSFEIPLPGKAGSEICVYLPTYRSTALEEAVLEGGTESVPHVFDSGRILFLGDSITQGYGSTPGFCYAARYARRTNRDFLNLGIGGAQMPGFPMPDSLIRERFTELVIAFGTNDCNCSREPADVGEALENLLRYFDARPGVKIRVISPLYFPNGIAEGKERLHAEITAAIRKTAESHRGVLFVNGLDLVPNDDAYFCDGAHPNNRGMAGFGENL